MTDRKSIYGTCAADGCERHSRTPNSLYCEAHYYRLRRGSKLGLAPLNTACVMCGEPVTRRGSLTCRGLCALRYSQNNPLERECAHCGRQYQWFGKGVTCSAACRKERDRALDRAWFARAIKRPEVAAGVRRREYERRAKAAGVHIERFDPRAIMERDGWICQICGDPTDRAAQWPSAEFPTIDHVVPLSLGGPHTTANTQCAHLVCNLRKNNKLALRPREAA